jgi:hypothetical protein
MTMTWPCRRCRTATRMLTGMATRPWPTGKPSWTFTRSTAHHSEDGLTGRNGCGHTLGVRPPQGPSRCRWGHPDVVPTVSPSRPPVSLASTCHPTSSPLRGWSPPRSHSFLTSTSPARRSPGSSERCPCRLQGHAPTGRRASSSDPQHPVRRRYRRSHVQLDRFPPSPACCRPGKDRRAWMMGAVACPARSRIGGMASRDSHVDDRPGLVHRLASPAMAASRYRGRHPPPFRRRRSHHRMRPVPPAAGPDLCLDDDGFSP